MNTQWRVSALAGALGILLLTGCAGSPQIVGAATPSATDPTPTPTPTVDALELTFGSAEQLVDAAWGIEWADPFVTEPGYAVLSPDDGNGSWSYTDESTGCELRFYQGEVSGLDWTKDDSAVSDEMLAILLIGDPTAEQKADVAASSDDYNLDIHPDDGVVAFRITAGAYPDGRNIVQATRMFGAFNGGLAVSMTCPAEQNSESEFGELSDSLLRVIVTQ